MINVVYDREIPMLSVSGHAGYAPEGQDIVCAAVSALVQTLAMHADNCEDNCEIFKVVGGDAALYNFTFNGICKIFDEYPQCGTPTSY